LDRSWRKSRGLIIRAGVDAHSDLTVRKSRQ